MEGGAIEEHPTASKNTAPEAVAEPQKHERILALIRKGEVGGDNYNAIYGNSNGKRELTKMTVDEIIAYQRTLKATIGHTPIGAYQMLIGNTIALKKALGLKGTELFDKELQDRMGLALLYRRKYDKYRDGKISRAQFQLELAREWASLPKDSSGLSFYHGKHKNKARVSHKEVLEVLK